MKKILVGLIFCAALLMAQKFPSQGVVPIGPVLGDTGVVFKENRVGIIVKNIYKDKDTAYNGSDEVSDNKHRRMRINMTKTIIKYGLGNGFDMRAIIPYVNKRSYMTNPKTDIDYNNKNSGLGDISLIGRYQLLSQKKGDPFFLVMGAGIKVPTGDTNKKQSLPTGEVVQPTMQLGSGSTDYIFEIGATKLLPNSRIDAHMLYKLNTKGDNSYEFGDKINWSLAYAYALNKNFDLQLEVDGEHSRKDRSKGDKVDYTGGDFIYVTPGFHYRPIKSFDISAGYAFMVHRDNNFDSAANMGGLSEDGKFVAKIRYIF